MARCVTSPAALLRAVAHEFDLGDVRSSSAVSGGLSNDLYRLESTRGHFAVKVMRVNADRPDFRRNIERACAIESVAHAHGVPCPRPVMRPDETCLARVADTWVRVHHWVDGALPDPELHAQQAGSLLASIHLSAQPAAAALDDQPTGEAEWSSHAGHTALLGELAEQLRRAAPALAELEAATSANLVVPHVSSHGDLDPKNTLLVDGHLIALDWDAARMLPRCPGGRVGRARLVRHARDLPCSSELIPGAGGLPVPAEPWVFGGWVSGLGGWLAYNATHRVATDLGRREVLATLLRLQALGRELSAYHQALR